MTAFINIRPGEIRVGGEGENLLVYLSPINSDHIRERIGKESLKYSDMDITITHGTKFKTKSGSVLGMRYLWVDADKSFIGAVNVTKINDQAIISNIYVRPDKRRMGIATRLVAKIKEDYKNVMVDNSMTKEGHAFFVRELNPILDSERYKNHLKGVSVNWTSLASVPVEYQTDELCTAAIKKSSYAIRYVENQTEELCISAVRKNGLSIEFVKNKTPKIMLTAVKEDGDSIQYIENQTDELCMHAVRQFPYALMYVKKQTENICLAAVKAAGRALEYVDNQTPEICLEAIKNDLHSVFYIKNMASIVKLIPDEIIQKGTLELAYSHQWKEVKQLKERILMTDDAHQSINEDAAPRKARPGI